jgi:hypothetical protein
MAIQKLEEIYLYVSEVAENPAENIQAHAFMDHSGLPYTRLFYNDASQHPEVLSAVNSWFTAPQNQLPPVTKFPFLVYTEVHDDIPARSSPVRYLEGIDAIKTFPEIYNQYM